MTAPKKAALAYIVTGTVLLAAALSLFLYNRYEDAKAGQKAENLLAYVQTTIQENQQADLKTDKTGDSSKSLETPEKIEEYEYEGYLAIPALGLELPVMTEWDYDRLKLAPCRQYGSAESNDMVIAAHNYKSHFGQIDRLKPGDAIEFTNMNGQVYTYSVAVVSTIAATDGELVQNSGYDLILYTCTYSGKERIAVFCERD